MVRSHGGWGVVARTSDGKLVAARAGCSSAIHDAFTAELHGMEEAFNLAADLGVIRGEFETDAQLLAMALNSSRPDFSSDAVIVEDLKVQMRTWFSSCKILFSRKFSSTFSCTIWCEL
jgi:ribonuclease HI